MRLLFCGALLGSLLGCSGGGEPGSPSDSRALDGSLDGADARRAPRPGDRCSTGRDCDDGVFCNGIEECLGGFCTSARNAACRDPGGCAKSSCDEAGGGCAFDPSGACALGVCRVDIGCVAAEGCTVDADCDDHRSCTDDRCDPGTKACTHLPVDARCAAVGACGVGVCLGDEVADDIGCGARPDAARCASNEGCDASFACARLPARCTTDADCDDGTLCDGAERCAAGMCVHGERTTCLARDACHHARCKSRTLGGAYCKEVKLNLCP